VICAALGSCPLASRAFADMLWANVHSKCWSRCNGSGPIKVCCHRFRLLPQLHWRFCRKKLLYGTCIFSMPQLLQLSADQMDLSAEMHATQDCGPCSQANGTPGCCSVTGCCWTQWLASRYQQVDQADKGERPHYCRRLPFGRAATLPKRMTVWRQRRL
jgi:hypothetical protein